MLLFSPSAACLRRFFFLLLTAVLLVASASDAADAPSVLKPGFAAGERFTYRVSWLGLHAATAVMEVGHAPPSNGRQMLRFLTTAMSSPVVTKFYAVDNRVESVVDAETFLPQRLLFRRREGRRKNDFDVTFHHTEGNVLSIKDGVPTTIPIPSGTQDSISCLYAIRNMSSLRPGFSQTMTVHHDKKNYRLEVRIEAGVKFWQEHADALARARRVFGVPEEIVVATIGWIGAPALLHMLATPTEAFDMVEMPPVCRCHGGLGLFHSVREPTK